MQKSLFMTELTDPDLDVNIGQRKILLHHSVLVGVYRQLTV